MTCPDKIGLSYHATTRCCTSAARRCALRAARPLCSWTAWSMRTARALQALEQPRLLPRVVHGAAVLEHQQRWRRGRWWWWRRRRRRRSEFRVYSSQQPRHDNTVGKPAAAGAQSRSWPAPGPTQPTRPRVGAAHKYPSALPENDHLYRFRHDRVCLGQLERERNQLLCCCFCLHSGLPPPRRVVTGISRRSSTSRSQPSIPWLEAGCAVAQLARGNSGGGGQHPLSCMSSLV